MLTRSITLAGASNIQIVLYFKSRSNAEKNPEPCSDTLDFVQFVDDFGQIVGLDKTKIISDLITDVKEMLLASGEMEIIKMYASKKFQERVDGDPLLKMWLEMQNRQKMMQRGMQPPVLTPNGMPAGNG